MWLQNIVVEPREQEFHPLMDREWETFISEWTLKIAHHLRVPLKGSLHSFATTKKELIESLDPRSEHFWTNLSKIIFMVDYLMKHHGSLSTGQAEFHNMFAQHVARKGHIANITRPDAMVSTHMGKKCVNVTLPKFVVAKLRVWRELIHQSLFRRYNFQCRISNKQTAGDNERGFYNNNRRGRVDSDYYLCWHKSESKTTKYPTKEEKVKEKPGLYRPQCSLTP
jgi:hypothetical protein